MLNKDIVMNALQSGEVQILFMKKDGTERKMKCTLAESRIPEKDRPKNSGKAKNYDSLAVFDLEKQEWRSFRWDSLIAMEK